MGAGVASASRPGMRSGRGNYPRKVATSHLSEDHFAFDAPKLSFHATTFCTCSTRPSRPKSMPEIHSQTSQRLGFMLTRRMEHLPEGLRAT
jgi:hypothetical protein